MRIATRRLGVAALLTITVGLLAPALVPSAAGAAGETTHAWMAQTAVDKVTIPRLKALLAANPDQVYAGASFPDSGYIAGTSFGEEAHWQRFYDAYAKVIKGKACGDITAPRGPCAPEIAHLLGSVAHGMGDEVWDWLFEPLSPDLHEYYLPDFVQAVQGPNGQELQLDLIALAFFGRSNAYAAPIPSTGDVIAALAAAGHTGTTVAELDQGRAGEKTIHDVEAQWTHFGADIRVAMPYMSANVVTEPGGVDFAATAIAAEWESMWGQLVGDQPATKVSITYPADGDRRIPATGWERATFEAGSGMDRGGARNRIAAALTYSMPYTAVMGAPAPGPPAGSMTLVERDSRAPVAIKDGYPKVVPYGPDSGAHVVDIQPAKDLKPCTWYEAGVTDKLLDEHQKPVTPFSWTFRTGPASGAGRCADDPLNAEENWVVGAYAALFGRKPTAAALARSTYQLDRAYDRVGVTSSLVASAEHRRRLVADSYQRYLGRGTDAKGLAFWAARIESGTLADLRSRLLGSDEAYRRDGGTDEAYVTAVYQTIFGRKVEAAGLAHWTAAIASGTPRSIVARRLLLSPEAIRGVVATTYQSLLGRAATAAELAHDAAKVRATDERALTRAVLASAEYLTHAQPT